MISVFILAPTLAARAGLRVLLTGAAPGAAPGAGYGAIAHEHGPGRAGDASTVEVLGEASALPIVGQLPPQVDVLLLAGLAGVDPGGRAARDEAAALAALAALAQAEPGRLAVLLLDDEPHAGVPALSELPWRAWGRLPGDPSAAELIAAVHALAEGLLVGPPELLRAALAPPAPALRLLANAGATPDAPPDALTERESQVLQQLARGLANKQIALALGISDHTVKFHVASIYAKLGASNRTEAVRLGIQQGLIMV